MGLINEKGILFNVNDFPYLFIYIYASIPEIILYKLKVLFQTRHFVHELSQLKRK
jgi:hypothetical protein